MLRYAHDADTGTSPALGCVEKKVLCYAAFFPENIVLGSMSFKYFGG